MYNQELKIAKQATRQAGQMIKKEFFKWKRGQAKFKEPKQIVTWVDKKSERIIFSYLNKYFPDYNIISEESRPTDKTNDYTWIVDPLDGTSNFTTHHPYFAVSIALRYKKNIVVSVTYDIILNEIFWAVDGQGAYCNNKKLSISTNSSLKKSIISYTHGAHQKETKQAFKIYTHFHLAAQKCRNFACTSLQMADTAAGHDEAFISFGSKLWDVAAGALLIKEAGGLVTDKKHRPWNSAAKEIICANQKLHPILLRELKKIGLA